MVVRIIWLGHASFKIEGKYRVYIDPWKIEGKDEADLILVTHSHYDHLSPDDVKKLQGKKTLILAPPDAAKKLKGNVREVKPGQSLSIKEMNLQIIPAYNKDKPYHPRQNNWVGYVLEIEGISIYHSGDTDFIPEMEKLNPYLALLPIGGTYTMGVEDALRAVQSLNPQIAIPMHYGEIVGTLDDAQRFAQKCSCQVKVLSKGESMEIG